VSSSPTLAVAAQLRDLLGGLEGDVARARARLGQFMPHTRADGGYDHFLDAYAHVTAASTRLTPRNAASEIDRLILTAWREKRPVYLRSLWSAAPPLRASITPRPSSATNRRIQDTKLSFGPTRRIRGRRRRIILGKAMSPTGFAGTHAARPRRQREFRRFVAQKALANIVVDLGSLTSRERAR
jgi:TPP-dependent 2-oxoacid decarboxylase